MCTDPGKTCSCGRGCDTFGQCMRNKRMQLGRLMERDKGKAWDAEVSAFYDAARQGVVPESTRMADIRAALDVSDKTGSAYGAI